MINTDCVELSHHALDQVSNNTRYQVQIQVYEKVDYQVWDMRWKVYAQVWDKVFR